MKTPSIGGIGAIKPAHEAYKDNQEKIKIHIKELQSNLAAHSKLFKKGGQRNWGYVGDLQYIEGDLKQILSFLNMKKNEVRK